MSYLTLADLSQLTPPPVSAPAAAAEPSTGAIVAGIVGSVLTAGATIGVGLLKANTDRRIAKDQAKSDMRIAAIEQQRAAQQAMLAASLPPLPAPAPALDVTKIAIIGGAALAGVTVLALVLGGGGKKRRKREEPQYPGPWGPPPGMGWGAPPPWAAPPPGWGAPPPPPPAPPAPPTAANPRRRGGKK